MRGGNLYVLVLVRIQSALKVSHRIPHDFLSYTDTGLTVIAPTLLLDER